MPCVPGVVEYKTAYIMQFGLSISHHACARTSFAFEAWHCWQTREVVQRLRLPAALATSCMCSSQNFVAVPTESDCVHAGIWQHGAWSVPSMRTHLTHGVPRVHDSLPPSRSIALFVCLQVDCMLCTHGDMESDLKNVPNRHFPKY